MALFTFWCITEETWEEAGPPLPVGCKVGHHKQISFIQYLKCKFKGHECYIT